MLAAGLNQPPEGSVRHRERKGKGSRGGSFASVLSPLHKRDPFQALLAAPLPAFSHSGSLP